MQTYCDLVSLAVRLEIEAWLGEAVLNAAWLSSIGALPPLQPTPGVIPWTANFIKLDVPWVHLVQNQFIKLIKSQLLSATTWKYMLINLNWGHWPSQRYWQLETFTKCGADPRLDLTILSFSLNPGAGTSSFRCHWKYYPMWYMVGQLYWLLHLVEPKDLCM